MKIKKFISIVLLAILVISIFGTTVMATEPKELKNVTGSGNVGTNTIYKSGRNIVSILQSVGVVLSVVVLIVIGIKYMMGSAEEKAEYKKTLMPYVIGAALIFAASIFAQVAYDFFNNWNA